MDDDQRAELLLQHYNDTFAYILYHWKSRNRLFASILLLLAILALDLARPGSLAEVANALLAKSVGADAPPAAGAVPHPPPALDFSAVGSLSWFILLCLVIQYYQKSIHVDRQYRYVSNVEERISELAGGDFITREGKAYFSTLGVYAPGKPGKPPLYLRAVAPLYSHVFPVGLCLFVLGGLWSAWRPGEITTWLNALLGLTIVSYSALYLYWVTVRK
jgi:hypothetical protein